MWHDPCIACGLELNRYSKDYVLFCYKCSRGIHEKCHSVLLLAERFSCNAITEPLEGIGVKATVSKNVAEKPARPDMLCVICGELADGETDVVCSEHNCEYRVHFECGEALAGLNGEEFVAESHVCNHVNYYLKATEVEKLLDGSDREKQKITKSIKRRGPIDYRTYDKKRKRYENADVICEKCNKVIGINEENHDLMYCDARYMGTPIPSRDYYYSMSKYKRIRRCALYDYPP